MLEIGKIRNQDIYIKNRIYMRFFASCSMFIFWSSKFRFLSKLKGRPLNFTIFRSPPTRFCCVRPLLMSPNQDGHVISFQHLTFITTISFNIILHYSFTHEAYINYIQGCM